MLLLTTMRRYREELAVAAYLFDLSPELSSQVRGQILGADSILDLETTFSQVLRISMDTPIYTSDYSTMASTRGCGHSSG